jgi:hypothetical protein
VVRIALKLDAMMAVCMRNRLIVRDAAAIFERKPVSAGKLHFDLSYYFAFYSLFTIYINYNIPFVPFEKHLYLERNLFILRSLHKALYRACLFIILSYYG